MRHLIPIQHLRQLWFCHTMFMTYVLYSWRYVQVVSTLTLLPMRNVVRYRITTTTTTTTSKMQGIIWGGPERS